MVYLDTSVLVALCVREPKSATVTQWYAACREDLGCSVWSVTEFASALGIKQRTLQITSEQAANAWKAFESLCANDLQLLPVDISTFYRAAELTLAADSGLRAGDALHLAVALEARIKRMATLDETLARNAARVKIDAVAID
jgi:predicted nucleic acid-binding protein